MKPFLKRKPWERDERKQKPLERKENLGNRGNLMISYAPKILRDFRGN